MTIVIIILLLIHRNIFYPSFLIYSLLSCCYTHHHSLSLSLIFFFVNVNVSCSSVVFLTFIVFYFTVVLYSTVRINRGHFRDRTDGREKILTANDARFCCVLELVSKGSSSDHAQLGVKLVGQMLFLFLL